MADLLRPRVGARIAHQVLKPQQPCYVKVDTSPFVTTRPNLAVNTPGGLVRGAVRLT